VTLLRRALPLLALAALAAGSARASTPLAQIEVADARYDVRVVALVEATRVTKKNPDSGLNGTRTATVRWTGTWQGVQVRVLRPTAALVINANAPGSIRGAFEFADRRPAHVCRGSQRFSSSARLTVAATRRSKGPTSLDLATFALNEIEPSFCPDDDAKLPFEDLRATVESLRVRIADANQRVSVERTDPTRSLFVPVEQLRDGVSFSISSRVHVTSDRCGYRFCKKTVRAEVRLTFTPRR
jgi:hypothetical protein